MGSVVTLSDFLAAFYPGANDPIRLRAFKPKGVPDGPLFFTKKIGITRAQLSEHDGLQSELKAINETRGLYFVVNSGGDCDADITRVTSFFAEIDDLPVEQQLEMFLTAPLLPSILNLTRKSVHSYWLPLGDCTIEQWVEIQTRLISHFGSDKTIKNPSRVMRLPYFDHIHYVKETGELERKRVELYSFDANRRYTVEQMLEAFPAIEKEQQESKAQEYESEKNKARFWTGFACGDERAEARRHKYAARAIEVACNIISDAPDGSRHDARRRASVLLGGYISGGMLTESEARAALENAVRSNTDSSITDVMKTIESGLKHGQRTPITFEQKEYERTEYLRRRSKPILSKPPCLNPILRPKETVALPPPARPSITVQLGKPMRPTITTEVAR